MRGIVAAICALLGLLLCEGAAQAGVAPGESPLSRTALMRRQGFAEEFIRAGNVQEKAPVLLARRRRRSRRGASDRYSFAGSSKIQVDPNEAELDKLMMLPLLSREEAEAIIEYRKAHRIDCAEDMLQINGVKPSHFRIYRHLIVVREGAVAGEMGAATTAPQVLGGGTEAVELGAATSASRL